MTQKTQFDPLGHRGSIGFTFPGEPLQGILPFDPAPTPRLQLLWCCVQHIGLISFALEAT